MKLTPHRRPSAPRRGVRAVAVTILSIASVIAGFAMKASADTWPMTPDQQKYATANGVDPYQDKDLHVSLVAGKPQAISYLHFDLASLPSGSAVSGFAVTLTPNETSGQNVSQSAAFGQRISACIETKPFPTQFDPSSTELPYDCAKLAVGLVQGTSGSWSVELAKFVEEWKLHGNTGLALVAIPASTGNPQGDAAAGGSQDNYVVSFDHAKTVANVTYTLTPAAPAGNERPNPPAVTGPVSQPVPLTAVAPAAAPVTDPPAASAAQAPSPNASSAPKPWVYGFVALWAVCATMLAVGVVMKLHSIQRISLRDVLGAIRRAVRQKSTWIAGVPLLVVVGGAGTGFYYMLYMDSRVTPPLGFSDGRSASVVAGAPPASAAPSASGAALGGGAQAPAGTTVRAPKQGSGVVTDFDGRWVLGNGTVAGYRIGYSSPTGRGIRTGRTNGTDGVKGEIRITGTTVASASFSVEMSKVNCDGGSACTSHINEIMDAANHPFETFELTRAIDVGSVPAEGQQLSQSVTGKLTLRGVTRLVTFTLTARRVSGHIEVLGSIPVNRDDYKIPDSGEPGFAIDKDGTIEILMVLYRAR